MRPRSLLLVIALVVGAAACGSDDPGVRAQQADKPLVVTALRPLAEAAERVGGDAIVVVNLVPAGTSPHGLELTRRQREEVLDADLAIVVGRDFQPELERAAASRSGPTLDVLEQLTLPDRPDGADGPVDHHVWLDPRIMGSIVTAIADAIAAVVPEDASSIRDRAASMVEQHVLLDGQLQQGLGSCERTVIASQHEAFGWFAVRYGFTAIAVNGTAPDDDPEPEPALLEALESHVADGSVRTLFSEPLTPPSWLEVIGEERGLEVALLNPLEGLTVRESVSEHSYRRLMLENLEELQDQLDCGT